MNRYQSIPTIIIDNKPVYRTVKYPEIPLNEDDIYVTTVQGDRFDILANQYYQDETLWWIISTANNSLSQNSLIIPEGIQLRIPSNPSDIVNSYNNLNS
jgi:phage tail protein X